MLNMLQINEPIKDIGPLLALTENTIYRRYDAMAKPTDTTKTKKRKRENLIGRVFGRLTVVEDIEPIRYGRGKAVRRVRAKCVCGNFTDVVSDQLKSGHTKSCGCLKVIQAKNVNLKHGLSRHPIYYLLSRIKERCLNKNNSGYKNYGGRGVTVCDEWLNSFESFYEWAIKNGWRGGLQIDRKNNDKGYSPSNCRFVPHFVNVQNTRLLGVKNTSGYRGVSRVKGAKRWCAEVNSKGSRYYLGRFSTPEKAARAYDAKVKELGSAHPLNFPS